MFRSKFRTPAEAAVNSDKKGVTAAAKSLKLTRDCHADSSEINQNFASPFTSSEPERQKCRDYTPADNC